MAKPDDKIEVENINCPGVVTRVNRAKYEAMRQAMMAVIPAKAPGLTAKDLLAALHPHLHDTLYPKGKTSGWWMKTVQLDLEAKSVIVRTQSKPLRWHCA